MCVRDMCEWQCTPVAIQSGFQDLKSERAMNLCEGHNLLIDSLIPDFTAEELRHLNSGILAWKLFAFQTSWWSNSANMQCDTLLWSCLCPCVQHLCCIRLFRCCQCQRSLLCLLITSLLQCSYNGTSKTSLGLFYKSLTDFTISWHFVLKLQPAIKGK